MGELLHRERLWPSVAAWCVVAVGTGFGAAVGWLGGAPGAVLGALVGAALVAAYLASVSTVVEVWSEGGLRAGRARVPSRFLAGGVAARGEEARWMRGPGLDARTHLCLRGWVDPVVLVHLDDPEDPTPSWLVSTRHPEELLAAVQRVSRAAPADG